MPERGSSGGECAREASGGGAPRALENVARASGAGVGPRANKKMFCDEFLETVEAIAAGDVMPDARVDAHLATCVNCAAALNAARQVERLLKARSAPQAPAQFTSRVLGRVRGDRWRREQFLDAGFNLAIGVIVFAAVAGLWMLFSQSGMSSVARDAFDVLSSAGAGFIERAVPSLPLYLGAAGALATALGVWWWAERDVQI